MLQVLRLGLVAALFSLAAGTARADTLHVTLGITMRGLPSEITHYDANCEVDWSSPTVAYGTIGAQRIEGPVIAGAVNRVADVAIPVDWSAAHGPTRVVCGFSVDGMIDGRRRYFANFDGDNLTTAWWDTGRHLQIAPIAGGVTNCMVVMRPASGGAWSCLSGAEAAEACPCGCGAGACSAGATAGGSPALLPPAYAPHGVPTNRLPASPLQSLRPLGPHTNGPILLQPEHSVSGLIYRSAGTLTELHTAPPAPPPGH